MNSKGTLLFCAPSAYPFGGIADWLEYILPGLEKHAWRCMLALPNDRYHRADRYLEQHPWSSILLLESGDGTEYGRMISIRRAILQVKPSICVSVNIGSVASAVRYLRRSDEYGGKFALALHGLQANLLHDVSSQRDVLDAVITPNRLASALASEALGDTQRSFYAPCGVETSFAPISSPNIVDEPKLKLLFAGRVENDQKRVFDLVGLADALAKRGVVFEIRIAGEGPESASLREMIGRAGYEAQFKILGVLSKSELALEYRQSDILLITSSWETGPIVAWEAMMAGTPIVASRYIGSGVERALVDRETAMLFDVGDMEAAADCVMELKTPTLRRSLTERARALCEQRYTTDRSIADWSNALSKILDLRELPTPEAGSDFQTFGRLDKALGHRLAHATRRILGKRFEHPDAGSEWPHALSHNICETEFLAKAAKLDHRALS